MYNTHEVRSIASASCKLVSKYIRRAGLDYKEVYRGIKEDGRQKPRFIRAVANMVRVDKAIAYQKEFKYLSDLDDYLYDVINDMPEGIEDEFYERISKLSEDILKRCYDSQDKGMKLAIGIRL